MKWLDCNHSFIYYKQNWSLRLRGFSDGGKLSRKQSLYLWTWFGGKQQKYSVQVTKSATGMCACIYFIDKVLSEKEPGSTLLPDDPECFLLKVCMHPKGSSGRQHLFSFAYCTVGQKCLHFCENWKHLKLSLILTEIGAGTLLQVDNSNSVEMESVSTHGRYRSSSEL